EPPTMSSAARPAPSGSARRATPTKKASASARRIRAMGSGAPGGWGSPIHEQPVEAKLLGCLGEFHKVHRFPHIAVRTEAVALDEIALLVRGGEDHYR